MFNLINNTISDFCKTINIDLTELQDEESLLLQFDEIGIIYFEESESGLEIHNIYESCINTHKNIENLLCLCHYDLSGNFDIKCYLSNQDEIILKTQILRKNVSIQTIEESLIKLFQLKNKIS